MLLLHGTTATHAASIERLGLLPAGPGGWVYLTGSTRYAAEAAWMALASDRHRRGGDELKAEGLVVVVDATGLDVRHVGLRRDPAALGSSWRTERVEPERIVDLRRLTLALPDRGSDDERAMLAGRFGLYRPEVEKAP